MRVDGLSEAICSNTEYLDRNESSDSAAVCVAILRVTDRVDSGELLGAVHRNRVTGRGDRAETAWTEALQVLGANGFDEFGRGALPAVLRSSYGPQGYSARGLFSDAFDWVFRGT